jgi:hypothetical protein
MTRDLWVFRPALRLHEAKTSLASRRVVGLFGGRGPSTRCQPSECARWSPLRPSCGRWLAEGSPAPPFEGSQVALVYPPADRRCVRGAVGSSRPVGLATSAAYSRSQNQSFWRAESRRRLIWWSMTLDTLSTVEMCLVVAAASVGRVRTFRGFSSGAVRGIAGRAGVPGVSCEARCGCRSRRPDVFGHRSVVEGLHRPNRANDDSR